MRYKVLFSFMTFCLLLAAPGCWDRREIEERGFILGVAVDKPAADGAESGERQPKFRMTLQKAIVGKQQSQENQPTGQKIWNLEGEGNTVFQIIRDEALRSNLPPFFEHIQTIIIGEKLAREGVMDLMDFFTRDPEMRRRVRLLITPGEARQVLNTPIPTDDPIAVMLAETVENEDKNHKIFSENDLGKFIERLHKGENAVVPRVMLKGNEPRIEGAAVFRKDRLVGWLNGEETEAFNWIRGTVKGGVVELKEPFPGIGFAVFEIARAKARVRHEIKANKIIFRVRIDTEGNVGEISDTQEKVQEPMIEAMEYKVTEHVRKKGMALVKKAQTGLKTDIFGFGNLIERGAPNLWDLKREWDEKFFPAAEVTFEVNVKINRMGLTK